MNPATAIIPARYNSQRFPGKMLANETGKPLIQHVYERTLEAKLIRRTIVATDDQRIVEVVEQFGGEACLTRTDHANGTSRIAEVAATLEDDFIVNIQGDEPEIEPELIDCAIQTLVDHPDCVISTVASPFSSEEDPADPNIVKVVIDQSGKALLFTRALVPHHRDLTESPQAIPFKHVGMYVYHRPFLSEYVSLPPTPLEVTEKLEQLRVLEHGYQIAIAVGEANFHGIDTPEQYAEFVKRVTS